MASNQIDWENYYKQFDDTRKANADRRIDEDIAAKQQIDKLTRDVEREGMIQAEKGKKANINTLNIKNTNAFSAAKDAWKANQSNNPQVAQAGWEANLNMGRQEGEQANPWDNLRNRLTNVQQNVMNVNQQTKQKQNQQEMQAAKDEFNKRSKEIMDNDNKAMTDYRAAQAKWTEAVNKYSDQAYADAKAGKKLVTSPYAAAMADCKAGKGPCPPQVPQVNSSQDPNNLSPTGQSNLTQAQIQLRKRLQEINKEEDESWSFGSGSDASGFNR